MTKVSLHPTALRQARDIAANPQPRHTAAMRLLAWAVLKSARGQTLRQSRLEAEARKGAA